MYRIEDLTRWFQPRGRGSFEAEKARIAGPLQRGVAVFCKPFTKAAVRYFDAAEAHAARTWVESE